MQLSQQVKRGLIDAPSSLRLAGVASLRWFALYVTAGSLVFLILSGLLLGYQQDIKQALLDYFFPQSWQWLSERLGLFFFESQTKSVVANAILSGSLVLASVFLFPIKEQYSAAFERDGGFNNGPPSEFSLWIQAQEESKLLLLYLCAQSLILWLGYYPYPWAQASSIALSYGFLFFSFALDFIAPTLQRHRIKYTVMVTLLLKNPLLALLFGALFSAPMLLLSQYVFSREELTLIEMASVLFIASSTFYALAIPAGTYLASSLITEARLTAGLRPRPRGMLYAAVLLTLTSMLLLHGGLIASAHHKSQLLKAQYSIDWSSIRYQLPALSTFLHGEVATELSFDLSINNTTEFDIVIEPSQLIIEKGAYTIAKVDLAEFSVPAGTQQQVAVVLDSISNISNMTADGPLLEGWRVDLHFQLWPGIPFIIAIVP